MEQPERSEDSRQAVLDAVCRRLWDHDEAKIRIADVCHETGLSSSVIYNYFRSRQGLIDAAYLSIYRDITEGVVANTRLVADEVTTTDEFIDNLRRMITDPFRRKEFESRRHMRLRITTAAISRSSMQHEFAAIQHEFLGGLATLFAEMQNRGAAGTLLTPDQLAIMFEVCVLLRSFTDIALEPLDDEEWLSMLATVLKSSAETPPTRT